MRVKTLSLSLSLPFARLSPPSYQHLAILLLAIPNSGQRGALHRLVAPLVGILQSWLQEVEAGTEPNQHQHGHQQVNGNEPVQEHQGHGMKSEDGLESAERKKGLVDWSID